MRLPRVWFPTTALPSPITAALSLTGPNWEVITDCTVDEQDTDNWCWAAVTQALEGRSGARPSQCQIVGEFLHQQCCNGEPLCDRPEALIVVLDRRGHLAQNVGGQAGFPDVVNEIRAGHPVCCFIERPPLNHFVIINGVNEPREAVAVIDPDRGIAHDPQEHDYRKFQTGYANGLWRNTYFTG